MRLLLKREGTNKMRYVEFKKDDILFDIIPEVIKLLGFNQNSNLTFSKADGEKLNEDHKLSSLKDKLVLIREQTVDIINPERAAIREQTVDIINPEQRAANASKATSFMEKANKDLRPVKGQCNLKDSYEELSKKSPKKNSTEHKLLADLKEATKAPTYMEVTAFEPSTVKETKRINGLLNSEGVEGFAYQVLPETYIDYDHSEEKEFHGSSEQEMSKIKNKVKCTSSEFSSRAGCKVAAWGLNFSLNGGCDSNSGACDGSKEEVQKKTTKAFLKKTSFHSLKRFSVKIELSEKAIQDAKDILDFCTFKETQKSISEFYNKYCRHLYKGPFYAGGWVGTVATATSTESICFTSLLDKASRQMNLQAALGVGGSGSGGGIAGSSLSRSDHKNQEEGQETSSSIAVCIRKESMPGNTNSSCELEKKIRASFRNWTVFPSNYPLYKQFIPVYEIMEAQAEETENKELKKISNLMKLHMKILQHTERMVFSVLNHPKIDFTPELIEIIENDSFSQFKARFKEEDWPVGKEGLREMAKQLKSTEERKKKEEERKKSIWSQMADKFHDL